MHLTISELRSRWPELSERLLSTFHARQLPVHTTPDAPAATIPPGNRIDVATLPDSALQALCTAQGHRHSSDRSALLSRLRPATSDAPLGHFDFSLPTAPQLRALLSALGASCTGNASVLAHRTALTWARRGAVFSASNAPGSLNDSTAATPAATPTSASANAADSVPTLAPIIRPAHVVRNEDGTWRRPRGAARKNCSWDCKRGAWVPALPR